MNHKSNFVLALTSIICLAAGSAVAASADSPSISAEEGPQLAQFQGGQIDLSKDWGDAQACIVFSATDVQCFATNEEADAAVGYVHEPQTSEDGVAVAWYCPTGWLCLYQDHWGGGRRLQFSYERWVDLANHNAIGNPRGISSWCNSQGPGDTGILKDVRGATISLSPGYCMNLGGTSWNDRARYVHA